MLLGVHLAGVVRAALQPLRAPACHPHHAGLPEQPQPPPGDPGVQRCMAHRHSLRAYMGLLFLRWPAGFRLRLRGSDMQHTPIRCAAGQCCGWHLPGSRVTVCGWGRIPIHSRTHCDLVRRQAFLFCRDWMRWPAIEEYRPRGIRCSATARLNRAAKPQPCVAATSSLGRPCLLLLCALGRSSCARRLPTSLCWLVLPLQGQGG